MILAYTARLWAHNLIALSASLKVLTSGTRLSISSFTLIPFSDLSSASSRPRSRLESDSDQLASEGSCLRTAILVKIRSMLMPKNSNLMIGTYASLTTASSVMAPGGVMDCSRPGKISK